VIKQFTRNANVAEYAVRKANGMCELPIGGQGIGNASNSPRADEGQVGTGLQIWLGVRVNVGIPASPDRINVFILVFPVRCIGTLRKPVAGIVLDSLSQPCGLGASC